MSQDDVDHEGDEGCRTGKVEVGFELIAHAHALGLRGHDGGVGDEGEVVAKEGATHHDGYDEGERRAGLLGYTHRHGGERHDGTHRGSYGERYEAGGKEEAGQEHAVGQHAQCEVYRGIDSTHSTGGLGKGAGKDEYPHHEHKVLVAGTTGEDGDALLQLQLGGDAHGIGRSREEGYCQGNFVEVTGKNGAY